MATWKSECSMLTKRGIEILNKVKAGIGSITVTRIVAGSSRVAESLLANQTSMSGNTKDMTVSHVDSRSGAGSEISVYITNEGYTESFDLHVIGVFVTHEDYEGEQLYHISQCDESDFDHIPVFGETVITYGYSLFLEHGNSSSINITISPQGMITRAEFDSYKESAFQVYSDSTGVSLDTFTSFGSKKVISALHRPEGTSSSGIVWNILSFDKSCLIQHYLDVVSQKEYHRVFVDDSWFPWVSEMTTPLVTATVE